MKDEAAVPVPPAVAELGRRLALLGWISDLFVTGSVATGDYVPGVSDLDLVAVVVEAVDPSRLAALSALHADLDRGAAAGLNLGCVYVSDGLLRSTDANHPTWTHTALVWRSLSGITRVELARHGYALFGRPPQQVLPPVSDQDVRAAAHAELTGYWAGATRRPWWWLDPVFAELSLTSMARGREGLAAGQLLTKTQAIELACAPPWLILRLRLRRRGETGKLPHLRTAQIAWRDAVRTTANARRSQVDCA